MAPTGSDKSPLIVITTGDLSGDMHAGYLIPRLRQEWASRHPESPDLRIAAAGAEHLKKAGSEIWEDTTFWGAMGIFEGIKKLPTLLTAKKRLVSRIRRQKPDLIIAVDFRAVNMSILKDVRIRRDGRKQPAAYYIAPVFWHKPSETAEHKAVETAVGTLKKIPGAEKHGVRDRFDAMAELVDLALVAYPIGLDYFENAGVNYRYIGHPLGQIAHDIATEKKYLREYERVIQGQRLVCIAPGSRTHELKYHMPVLRELVSLLIKRYPNLWFFCPVPSPKFASAIREGFEFVSKRITFVPDDCYDLMAESDLMIVKSGTSVQLSLLLAVPSVTFYKVASDWMIKFARRFFHEMPYYTFPNLLAGHEVVPEFIQSRFTLPNLYVACTELLDDPARAGHMRAELAELRKATMKPDPIGEASRELCNLLDNTIAQ